MTAEAVFRQYLAPDGLLPDLVEAELRKQLEGKFFRGQYGAVWVAAPVVEGFRVDAQLAGDSRVRYSVQADPFPFDKLANDNLLLLEHLQFLFQGRSRTPAEVWAQDGTIKPVPQSLRTAV